MHIAVVIPAFNIAPFLPDAIQSVLDQTHVDWSLVVVDDGSTDTTASVAARFRDERIKVLRQEKNTGISAARNAGVRTVLAGHDPVGDNSDGRARVSATVPRSGLARLPTALPASATPVVVVGRAKPDHDTVGEVASDRLTTVPPDGILFLDGDDWLAPDALALLAGTLDVAPWAVAAVGRYARVDSNAVARLSPPPARGNLLERLLTRYLFANGGHLLIRREAIEAAGALRPDLTYGEDWEYWTRLAVQGEFVSVPTRSPLLFVRERLGGAYLSRATDPNAYRPALDAIYRNPGFAERLGRDRLAALGRRAEAEMAWTVGRELIRHGCQRDGLRWLGRSIREAPRLKRLALVGLAGFRFGSFRPYRTAT